ncbi:hypothetical protein ACHHRT_06160 [Desulfurivibrio sp. D14AmB]|uniref:hypothetical protein n=1 Tax=Desulfurivibrio sp. D14AmB TaxID=3374370 RepID=UPI00376ED9B8
MADQGFLSQIARHFNGMGTGRKFIICVSLLVSALLLNGCAGPTTFQVLDAETKEPIEGAVALAMWYRTKGLPGLSSTYTAKAVEAESDADGFLRIPMRFGTFALDKPHLKIYKPGYVGWDSKLIYLGCRKDDKTRARYQRRENFRMKSQKLYLEPWKEEYSFVSHGSFIGPALDLREAGLKESKYWNAIDYEVAFRFKERETFRKKR